MRTLQQWQELVDEKHGVGNYTVLSYFKSTLEVRCNAHNHTYTNKSSTIANPQPYTMECSYCRAEQWLQRRTNYIRKSIEEIQERWPLLNCDRVEEIYLRDFGIGTNAPKVTVECLIHGEIRREVSQIRTKGCTACTASDHSNNGSKTYVNRDQLIARLQLIHGDTYDFSKVEYKPVGNRNKVTVGCKHGYTDVAVATLLKGGGCFYCSTEKRFRKK